jgi:hypothetical protein
MRVIVEQWITHMCKSMSRYIYIYIYRKVTRSRNSSVDISTGYELDGRGSIPVTVKIFFSSPQRPDRIWDLPSLLSNGYRGLFPRGVKRPGREAALSSLSSAEVKNGGAILPLRIHLHGLVLD